MKPTYPAVGDGLTTRLACCIPHCRRTFRNDKQLTPWSEGAEVICGKHYRMAPADLLARDRRLRRLCRRADRLAPTKQNYRLNRRLVVWQWQCFARIKAAVTERAMGIG
jgi:hypothetical protein